MSKNDTIVRPYEAEDIASLVLMVTKEVPQLPHYKGIDVEPQYMHYLLQNNLEADQYAVFVLIHNDTVIGFLAAWCVSSFLSRQKVTGDIYLTVQPQWRTLQNAKKLIQAYKDWGIAKDAKIISATVTSGYDNDAIQILLTKHLGFEKVGTLYHFRTK